MAGMQNTFLPYFGADDEARTRYLHLGKVALYQMSYIRKCSIIIANPQEFVKVFSPAKKNFSPGKSSG